MAVKGIRTSGSTVVPQSSESALTVGRRRFVFEPPNLLWGFEAFSSLGRDLGGKLISPTLQGKVNKAWGFRSQIKVAHLWGDGLPKGRESTTKSSSVTLIPLSSETGRWLSSEEHIVRDIV